MALVFHKEGTMGAMRELMLREMALRGLAARTQRSYVRMILRVDQGKGNKDRNVMLSPALLDAIAALPQTPPPPPLQQPSGVQSPYPRRAAV
jgi:hypothetical protein